MIVDIVYSKKIFRNPDRGKTERIQEHFFGRKVVFRDLNGKHYKLVIDESELPINIDMQELENKLEEKIKELDKFDENDFQ